MTLLHSLIARRWFGPQTQWRPLHIALTSGLGFDDLSLVWGRVIFTDRSKAVLLLWFILICYDTYNVCLLHDFVATLRLSALPSALYFVLSKLALWHLTPIAAHPDFRKTKCFVLCFTFSFLLCIILVIYQKLRTRLGTRDQFKPPSIFILTVPRRYFCCGSLLLLVLDVRIYTLVQLLC